MKRARVSAQQQRAVHDEIQRINTSTSLVWCEILWRRQSIVYVYPDGVRRAPLNLEKRGCEPGARFASKALPKCIWMNGICERTSDAMWPAWHCKSAGVFDHSSRLSSARQQASRRGTDENSTQISRMSSNLKENVGALRFVWVRWCDP